MRVTEDGEGNVIGDHSLGRVRIRPRVRRRFPEEYFSRLESELSELRHVLAQVNEDITAMSHRIERPRSYANAQQAVAGVLVEASALGHHNKASIYEELGDRRPLREEGRRAGPRDLDEEIEIVIGPSRQPGCQWSHVTRPQS